MLMAMDWAKRGLFGRGELYSASVGGEMMLTYDRFDELLSAFTSG
jgi:hypothetical protein